MFYITPRVQVISIPFMVAFMQCGSGHYDEILISTGDNVDNPSKDNGKCSCGKMKKLIKIYALRLRPNTQQS